VKASRWIPVVAGILLLAYGLYALWSGRVLITWARTVTRDSVTYWIILGALMLMGVMNLVIAIRTTGRPGT